MKGQFPALAVLIQGYIDHLNAIPPAKVTDLDLILHGADDALTKLRNIQSLLDAIGTAPTNVDVPQPGGPGGIPAAQHGLLVPGRPGQPVPILAHGGERILSADESRRSDGGGGGGVTIQSSPVFNFNQPIYGVDRLQEAMHDILDAHDAELERELRVIR